MGGWVDDNWRDGWMDRRINRWVDANRCHHCTFYHCYKYYCYHYLIIIVMTIIIFLTRITRTLNIFSIY